SAVAGHVVESPLASLSRGSLPLVAAGLATLGLVGEPLAGVELLIVGGEQEGAAAVDASQILVRVLLHHGSNRSPGFSPRDCCSRSKSCLNESTKPSAADRGGARRKVALGPTPLRVRSRVAAGTYGSRKEKHKGGGQMCGVLRKSWRTVACESFELQGEFLQRRRPARRPPARQVVRRAPRGTGLIR